MRLLLLIIFLASCSSSELSNEAHDVLVLRKLPTQRCQLLGTVKFNQIAASYEKAVINLRNEAADMGGDTLIIQRHSNQRDERRVIGAAYKCP